MRSLINHHNIDNHTKKDEPGLMQQWISSVPKQHVYSPDIQYACQLALWQTVYFHLNKIMFLAEISMPYI